MGQAIDRLLAGYASFRALHYDKRAEARRLAVEGQKPEVLMIACSDSRVDPAILFNADPGEIFVVRNVAALVPPYAPDGAHHSTSAALEFAVRDLKVREIVVLGHAACGGCNALAQLAAGGEVDREFIGPWVDIAREACAGHSPDDPDSAGEIERGTIRSSLDNLRGFPWVAEAEAAGRLNLHGWWFDLFSGDLHAHDPATGHFRPVDRAARPADAGPA